jgi:hypothetical protein
VGRTAAAVVVVIAFLGDAQPEETELPFRTSEELALHRAARAELRVQALQPLLADAAVTATAVRAALLALAVGGTASTTPGDAEDTRGTRAATAVAAVVPTVPAAAVRQAAVPLLVAHVLARGAA